MKNVPVVPKADPVKNAIEKTLRERGWLRGVQRVCAAEGVDCALMLAGASSPAVERAARRSWAYLLRDVHLTTAQIARLWGVAEAAVADGIALATVEYDIPDLDLASATGRVRLGPAVAKTSRAPVARAVRGPAAAPVVPDPVAWLAAEGLLDGVQAISERTGVRVGEMFAARRTYRATRAVHLVWAWMHEERGWSYAEIAAPWGMHRRSVHAAVTARRGVERGAEREAA